MPILWRVIEGEWSKAEQAQQMQYLDVYVSYKVVYRTPPLQPLKAPVQTHVLGRKSL